jgi:ferrous iron transport protein B
MKQEYPERESSRQPVFALIGNMNVGKTSIFARITAKKIQPVNIPGSTVAVSSAQVKGNRGLFMILRE